MKKIILSIFILNAALWAQSDQKNIELPDFVITGKQSVEISTAKKNKPDLISTISQDFLLPQYSPEEIPLLVSSSPVPIKPAISAKDYFDGSVEFGIGNYTYPTGALHLSKSFGYYLVSANAWGKNIREYDIPNSGYNTSGVSMQNVLFVDTKSGFLPGSEIKLNGEYSRESGKFFASDNPLYKQEIQSGFGEFSFSNNYTRWIDFSTTFRVNFLSVDQSNFDERVIESISNLGVRLNGFIIGGVLDYQKQILNGGFNGIDNSDYFSLDGFIKLNLINNMEFKGGIVLSGNGGNSFFAPFGSIKIPLGKGLTFSAEYKPYTENYTYHDMLKKNFYIDSLLTGNVFSEVKTNLNGTLNYQYEKFFSIGLTAGYSNTDGYLYFADARRKGKFDVFTTDGVDNFYSKLDLLFHPAQFGYFYGNIKFCKMTDQNDKYVPYEPAIYSELIYGYDLDFGLGLKAKLIFAKDIYADIANTNKLDDYMNLSFGASYKIWSNLTVTADFQNILNRSNFVFRGYEEKPFDVIAGIEYRW
jgi:hypothetical protein